MLICIVLIKDNPTFFIQMFASSQGQRMSTFSGTFFAWSTFMMTRVKIRRSIILLTIGLIGSRIFGTHSVWKDCNISTVIVSAHKDGWRASQRKVTAKSEAQRLAERCLRLTGLHGPH